MNCHPIIALLLWGALNSVSADDINLFPEPGDQQRFAKGTAEALNFRQQLLERDLKPFAEVISDFVRVANHKLATRERPLISECFKLSHASLLAHLQGTTSCQGKDAFSAFAGKWYGLWDKRPVDHHWGPVITHPSMTSKDHLVIQTIQYAWIGDGFGWNIVAADKQAPEKTFVLGTVYHVKEGTQREVHLHRPHVGIAVDAQRLIWMTKGEVFLEEAIEFHGEPAYAITGFRYQLDNRTNQPKPGDAFQAIYTRDPNKRPEWISFPFAP